MNSFNFFFILAGALAAGYLTAIGTKAYPVAAALALLLLATSAMFWRLDLRNRELISASESYLKESEAQMAAIVGDKIRLLRNVERGSVRPFTMPLSGILSSYRKIFRFIFVSVMSFAAAAFLFAIWMSTDPIQAAVT
jgi:Flp pilus assembly protein TadB